MSFATASVTDSFEHPAVEEQPAMSHHDLQLARQRVFALRFRTELCRTHASTGRCEYRDKCMFAHGEVELRTEAMNEADGLESDKAIRAWLRDRRRCARDKRTQRVVSTKTARKEVSTVNDNIRGHPIVSRQTESPVREVDAIFLRGADASNAAAESPTQSCSSRSSSASSHHTAVPAVGPRFRYNPYSMIRVRVTV